MWITRASNRSLVEIKKSIVKHRELSFFVLLFSRLRCVTRRLFMWICMYASGARIFHINSKARLGPRWLNWLGHESQRTSLTGR